MPLHRGSLAYKIKCKRENQMKKRELRVGGEGEIDYAKACQAINNLDKKRTFQTAI